MINIYQLREQLKSKFIVDNGGSGTGETAFVAVHPDGLFVMHHDNSFWGLGLITWENIQDISDYYISPHGTDHGLNIVGGDAVRIEVYDTRQVFKNFTLMSQSAGRGEWYANLLSRWYVRKRGYKIGVWWKALGDILFFPKEITYFAETDEYVIHLPKKHLSDELVQTMRHQLFLHVKNRAEHGDAECQFRLARFYEDGKGVDQDYVQAMYWCKKAWARDYKAAACDISWLYENGYGVEQNYVEAVSWAKKAINAGEPKGESRLAWLYLYGYGVKQDDRKAFELYLSAAQKGVPRAQIIVTMSYFEGQGVEQDYTKGVEWLEKAVKNRDVLAEFFLGHCFLKGEDLQQDYVMAYAWLSLAANQGEEDAQYEVGLMYEEGIQVEKDLDNAIYWYERAAQKGVEDALERIKEIENEKNISILEDVEDEEEE